VQTNAQIIRYAVHFNKFYQQERIEQVYERKKVTVVRNLTG